VFPMKNIPHNEYLNDLEQREAREEVLEYVLFVAGLPIFYTAAVAVMCL